MRLPDFSDLLASYGADFLGRHWLSDRLFALLDERDCRIVVLTAGPGMGKTAFLAHLASEHPDWPATSSTATAGASCRPAMSVHLA
jgi:hypothetical protein